MCSIDGGKDRKKKIEIAKEISFPPPPPMQAGEEFGTICCGRQGRKGGSRLPKNCIPKTAFAGCTRKKILYYEEKEHEIRRRYTALKTFPFPTTDENGPENKHNISEGCEVTNKGGTSNRLP